MSDGLELLNASVLCILGGIIIPALIVVWINKYPWR